MSRPPRPPPERQWVACDVAWLEELLGYVTLRGPAPEPLARLDARAWWTVYGEILPVSVALRRWGWADSERERARWLLGHPQKWARAAVVDHVVDALEARALPQRAPRHPRSAKNAAQ